MTLADNLRAVRERIERACAEAGRDPAGVRLLPVSKTWPAERVRELAALGVTRVGENRVQEAKAKAEELADLDLGWSIIGHLQTNKAKDVLGFADEVQSLDSVRLAAELHRRLEASGGLRGTGRPLQVYLQVNTSGEASKSGVVPSEALEVARELAGFATLQPVGLMTIAAPDPDPAVVRGCFRTLRELREAIAADPQAGGADRWTELSMGMSGDLALAIAEGSTVVRVGRAIFGERSTA